MILPQLEAGTHGVEVVGIFFFDDNTFIPFFLFAFGLSIANPAARSSGQVWTISLVIATIVAPIIGLISAFAVRPWGA